MSPETGNRAWPSWAYPAKRAMGQVPRSCSATTIQSIAIDNTSAGQPTKRSSIQLGSRTQVRRDLWSMPHGFDDDASTPYNSIAPVETFRRSLRWPIPRKPDDARVLGDGTIRVGGREYNGWWGVSLFPQRAKCRARTCHSMHDCQPDKQMAPLMQTNQACLQCHQSIASDISQHTHHAAPVDW